MPKQQTEQAHLVLGVESVSALDKDHFSQKLLSVILGGSMSSRMFLRIREARGLCYYISTSNDNYLDTGLLSTRAGVDQSRLHEAISAIRHEYEVCAKDGVTKDELRRAKDFLKLDCEGAEYEILYGLSDEYWEKIRFIALEYHPFSSDPRDAPGALTAFLQEKGYDVTERPNEILYAQKR